MAPKSTCEFPPRDESESSNSSMPPPHTLRHSSSHLSIAKASASTLLEELPAETKTRYFIKENEYSYEAHEVTVGTIVMLPQFLEGEEPIICVRHGHCDGPLAREGYGHPAVICKIMDNDLATSKEPICLMASVGTFGSLPLESWLARSNSQNGNNRRICRMSFPIHHQDSRHLSAPFLSLASGYTGRQAYVSVQHLLQVPLSCLTPYSLNEFPHHPVRLSRQAHQALGRAFDCPFGDYESHCDTCMRRNRWVDLQGSCESVEERITMILEDERTLAFNRERERDILRGIARARALTETESLGGAATNGEIGSELRPFLSSRNKALDPAVKEIALRNELELDSLIQSSSKNLISEMSVNTSAMSRRELRKQKRESLKTTSAAALIPLKDMRVTIRRPRVGSGTLGVASYSEIGVPGGTIASPETDRDTSGEVGNILVTQNTSRMSPMIEQALKTPELPAKSTNPFRNGSISSTPHLDLPDFPSNPTLAVEEPEGSFHFDWVSQSHSSAFNYSTVSSEACRLLETKWVKDNTDTSLDARHHEPDIDPRDTRRLDFQRHSEKIRNFARNDLLLAMLAEVNRGSAELREKKRQARVYDQKLHNNMLAKHVSQSQSELDRKSHVAATSNDPALESTELVITSDGNTTKVCPQDAEEKWKPSDLKGVRPSVEQLVTERKSETLHIATEDNKVDTILTTIPMTMNSMASHCSPSTGNTSDDIDASTTTSTWKNMEQMKVLKQIPERESGGGKLRVDKAANEVQKQDETPPARRLTIKQADLSLDWKSQHNLRDDTGVNNPDEPDIAPQVSSDAAVLEAESIPKHLILQSKKANSKLSVDWEQLQELLSAQTASTSYDRLELEEDYLKRFKVPTSSALKTVGDKSSTQSVAANADQKFDRSCPKVHPYTIIRAARINKYHMKIPLDVVGSSDDRAIINYIGIAAEMLFILWLDIEISGIGDTQFLAFSTAFVTMSCLYDRYMNLEVVLYDLIYLCDVLSLQGERFVINVLKNIALEALIECPDWKLLMNLVTLPCLALALTRLAIDSARKTRIDETRFLRC